MKQELNFSIGVQVMDTKQYDISDLEDKELVSKKSQLECLPTLDQW